MSGHIDKAFKSTVTTYISTFVAMLTGILMPVILVKYLSVEMFGTYRLVSSLIFAGTVITSFGLQAVLSRYLPDLITKRNFRAAKRLFLTCLVIRIFAAVFMMVLIWLLHEPLFAFFNFPDIFIVFFLPIAMIVILTLTNVVLGPSFLNALMEHKRLSNT